jgi:hypothetical protein
MKRILLIIGMDRLEISFLRECVCSSTRLVFFFHTTLFFSFPISKQKRIVITSHNVQLLFLLLLSLDSAIFLFLRVALVPPERFSILYSSSHPSLTFLFSF